ncbi:MAG: hypothetical protein GKR90_05210 [Pseudomonadales bacterium]|nr:hypothetical protein [Pseudomonadales bacterium]
MEIVAWLSANWLGLVGFVSGLLCVWLLIRENILTFPIGLLYSVITVVVMFNNKLYADVLLNLYYVLMNAYGWWFWLRGDASRRHGTEQVVVAMMPTHLRLPVLGISVLGIGLMGWYFDTYTDADLAYPDSFTTIISFVAMWMSAKKYLDSWVLWFVVNVVSVALYLLKAQEDAQLYFYVALYALYIWLAVLGWRTWREQMPESRSVTA